MFTKGDLAANGEAPMVPVGHEDIHDALCMARASTPTMELGTFDK